MYEFVFGLFAGAIGSKIAQMRQSREVGVQADELVMKPSAPINIGRKPFVPGQLTNFWGKDS
jgi:hypothetical protein